MARNDDFDEPYLPERYRQKIRDKQRGRARKKILIGIITGVIVVLAIALLSGYVSNGTSGYSLPPTPETTVSPQDTSVELPPPATSPPSGMVVNTSGLTIPAASGQNTPLITQEKAQEQAIRAISERNGGALPLLNLTSVRYGDEGSPMQSPRGVYMFFFERLFQGYPVDTDGIQVVVDGRSGDITSYEPRWTTPDFAFSQADKPAITQQDVTLAVMDAVKSRFPNAAENFRILSSGLRWNNQQTSDAGQRPGSVPLAWKVTFDDDTFPATTSHAEGIAWVDIQTGNITSLDYPS